MSYAERVDTFCQNIAEAFPHNEQGKPDFHGHGKAHISWIENSNREKKIYDYVERQMSDEGRMQGFKDTAIRAAISAVAGAFVLWVGVLLWQGVLQGPAKPVIVEHQK